MEDKSPKNADGWHYEALKSLAGLAGDQDKDVARFYLEDDPSRKTDFRKYVLHATNPKIDYQADATQSKIDQFVNANLREMRIRKLKKILLEIVKTKNGGLEGSSFSDKNISRKASSPSSGESLAYMLSKSPWKGRDGVFITASGRPIFETPLRTKVTS